MSKKLLSLRALSCALAMLAAIVFIIACGDGKMLDISAVERDINTAETATLENIKNPSATMWEEPSSSSFEEISSSSSDEVKQSSSNEEESSSSTKQSSSSAAASSSSSATQNGSSSYSNSCSVIGSPVTIQMTGRNAYYNSKVEIKCDGEKLDSTNVSEWIGIPAYNQIDPGTYKDFKVKLKNSVPKCGGSTINCTGTIIIESNTPPPPPPPSSTSTGNSSTGGNTSSSSRANSSSAAASSSSAAASGDGPCMEGGKATYCKWGSDCSAIDNRYGYMGTEATQTCGPKASKLCACADLIQNCKDYSDSKKVYTDDKCTGSGGGGGSSSSGSSGSCASWTPTANSTTSAGCHKASTTKTCVTKTTGTISPSPTIVDGTPSGDYKGNLKFESGKEYTFSSTVTTQDCW